MQEDDTINIQDFIQWAFDNHNVYLYFDIDFSTNKLVCKIIKNTTTGYIIKDNIKLSTPTFDKNELPSYNKAAVYNKDTGAILGTYYLLSNNTITPLQFVIVLSGNKNYKFLITSTGRFREALAIGRAVAAKAPAKHIPRSINTCLAPKKNKVMPRLNWLFKLELVTNVAA